MGLKVGLGFAIICVTVTRVPLFAVEVESVVMADGALVVSAPLLSVTVTKIGVESVELNEVIMILLSDNEGEKRTDVGVRIEVGESFDEGGRGIVEGEEKIGVEVNGGVEEDEEEKEKEKDENEDEDDENETDDGVGLTDGPKPEVEEEEKVLEEEEDAEDENEDMTEEKKEKEEKGRVVVVVAAVAVVVLMKVIRNGKSEFAMKN